MISKLFEETTATAIEMILSVQCSVVSGREEGSKGMIERLWVEKAASRREWGEYAGVRVKSEVNGKRDRLT